MLFLGFLVDFFKGGSYVSAMSNTNTTTVMNYAQQSNQPDWFNRNPDHFFYAVYSGSSPFNEWYEFASEEEALDFALTFESQSVIDHFTRATMEDGRDRWFHNDDIQVMADGWEPAVAKENASPASFGDLAQAESRF